MAIEIHALTLGPVATNSYLIGDTETQQAILIDPVDEAALIDQTARRAGWQIKLMLATHGHYDHVMAAIALQQLTDAQFFIHHQNPQLTQPATPVPQPFVGQIFPPLPTPARLLTDETETITLGAIELETLFTPGHAPDHVAYYMRDHGILFSGDALFAGSIGRTDLPYGDHSLLIHSIQTQIMRLPDETQLLPGHGEASTIGHERLTNPFLQS